MVFQPDSLPHSPPLSLLLPLYFLCLSIISSLRSTSPSTHRTIYLSLYLPAAPLSLLLPFSPTSPALIHLSDFTGTLGDPGQTSCRGNRQSRIFYFFYFVFFFSRREEERERERLESIWAPTDVSDRDRQKGRGLVSGWCLVSAVVCIHICLWTWHRMNCKICYVPKCLGAPPCIPYLLLTKHACIIVASPPHAHNHLGAKSIFQ